MNERTNKVSEQQVVKFVGLPDGPKVLVPEIGKEVGTFITEPGGRVPALHYHVPLNCRGHYRPKDLANYDSQKSYRTDVYGWALCQKFTVAGERCPKRALNRSDACNVHGGRLHPLDKLCKEIPEDEPAQELSRYQQFLAKQITVDDLDDEELASCGFRGKNNVIYRPKNIPREMAQAFNKAIFERAQKELRANTVDAAKTIAEIMKNTTIEPDIRLKAASIMLDRNLGKAPQVVALTADRAFEEIFSDIFTGTREQSRQQRTIIDSDGYRIGEADSSPSEGIANAPRAIEQSVERQSELHDVPDENANHASGLDARLFERNEAILAQSIEVKPFEYDLTDHSQEIKNATKKRYASRALGVDFTTPDYPLQRVEENGFIRWIDPKGQAGRGPNKKAEKKRKTYTLSDFD